MGLFDAALDSLGGMFADQWKDIVTAGPFDEHVVVAPGIRKHEQDGRGNNYGADDLLSNGSVIFVPENTAAVIFSEQGIEQIITESGGYEYRNGLASVFDKQDRAELGFGRILVDQAAERFGFSGMMPEEKRVAFVNLREIRGIRFGTRGPLTYNDHYYDADLEVYAYGSFTLRVSDSERFVRGFLPAGVRSYSFDDPAARQQLVAEFLHSFVVAVNALSAEHRISQLPAQANAISAQIAQDAGNAGTWEDRFGIQLAAVAIENIEFSDESRALVREYAEKKMSVRAYESISEHAASVAAQQLIAQGIRDNGLGDGGGMLFGMNLAGGLSPRDASVAGGATAGGATPAAAEEPDELDELEDQIEVLQKLKGLLDAGILSQEEFDAKKKQVLGL